MHPSEAGVTRPSQPQAAYLARDRPFDTRLVGLLRLNRLSGFPLPGRVECLVWWRRSEGACPAGIALLRTDTFEFISLYLEGPAASRASRVMVQVP